MCFFPKTKKPNSDINQQLAELCKNCDIEQICAIRKSNLHPELNFDFDVRILSYCCKLDAIKYLHSIAPEEIHYNDLLFYLATRYYNIGNPQVTLW